MNQYLAGFISAIVLTTSFFLFIGAKKRSIDNLTVQNITIVDERGKVLGKIGNKKSKSYLLLKYSKSKNADIEFNRNNGNFNILSNKSQLNWNVRVMDTGLETMTGGRLKKVINVYTFLFNSLQVLTFLIPFSFIKVIALLSSFFDIKFSAKFSLEFLRNLFLKNPKLSMMVRNFDKMKTERKKVILSEAEKFISKNTYAN